MDFYHGIIPCAYVVVKDILNTTLGSPKLIKVRKAQVIVLTLLALVLVFISMLPFLLLYGFVHQCLKIKYGDQYGCILQTLDTIFESFDPKVMMSTVFIVSHNGTQKELFPEIKEACSAMHQSNFRYSSIVQSFLGYRYYLKNQIHIDEVVVPVKLSDSEYLSREDLYEYLEECHHYIKTDDKRLWEAKIFLQPILWNDESKVTKHYAIIVRQNHSISDGSSMATYIKKYLCCEPMDLSVMKTGNKSKSDALPDYDILTANVHKVPFGDLTDYHLKPPHEGSSHHCVFFNETQAKYLPILLKLKKKYNITINDIVATSAIESISKYFQKESINQGNIFCVMTCRSAMENIADVLSGKIIGNESSGLLMSLPISSGFSATEKLKEVALACKKVRSSADRQLPYILMKLSGYCPAFLNEYYAEFLRATLVITNLPLPEFKQIRNLPIIDVFGSVNHFNQFKFILVLMSYKGQLRITLVARKGMVKNRHQLQEMLDGFLLYIDRLNEECDSNN